MRSRFFSCAVLLSLLLAGSGCGYVHLGKLPEPTTTVLGDAKLMAENAELKLDKKMLQQELALTRAQGDALRMAIENRTADGDTSRRLVQQLNDTTRELTQLRATHARLLAERTGPAGAATAGSGGGTELNEELTRLRSELARTREQNLVLTREVQVITAKHEQAQAALAQLNADLLSQREARQRAEDDVDLLRTELRNVAPNSSALAQLRSGTASEARTIVPARPAPASSGPTVISPETRRIELAAEPQIPASSVTTRSTSAPAASTGGGVNATFITRVPGGGERASAAATNAAGGRVHVVAAGDTLAKIATRYYGSATRWREILEANRDVLGEGNNLVVGHSLRIP